MATTRTPGITVLSDGRRLIDKRYLGVRIGRRVGAITQEQAEERLDIEIARVQCDLARKAHARPTFTDCAGRYIAQSRGKRSIEVIKWHVTLLQYAPLRRTNDVDAECKPRLGVFLGRVVIHDQVDIQIRRHGVDVTKSEMYLENGCRRHLDSYQRGFGASIAATGDPTSRLRCSCCFM